jgi:hypothetical protein
MLCDKYKNALIEVAVAGGRMAKPLQEHVNLCAHCRETFADQKAVLSAIDIELNHVANAEVPRSLRSKLMANLRVEKAPGYSRSPGWALVSAAVTLVLTVTLLGLPHGRERQTAAESTGTGKAAPNVVGALGYAPTLGRNTGHRSDASKAHLQRKVSTNVRLEVLVPREEEETVRRYCATLRNRPNATDVVLASERDRQPRPLVIEQIEFHELRIDNLEEQTKLIEMNTK